VERRKKKSHLVQSWVKTTRKEVKGKILGEVCGKLRGKEKLPGQPTICGRPCKPFIGMMQMPIAQQLL
jgi:hypothetical protein